MLIPMLITAAKSFGFGIEVSCCGVSLALLESGQKKITVGVGKKAVKLWKWEA